jgi:PIN domain
VIAYIDSSVLLRKLLNEPGQLNDISPYEKIYSSVIIRIECKRVLHRLALQEKLDDEQYSFLLGQLTLFLNRIFLIDFGRPIQRRAEEPFFFPIGSLDAIHLSSALAIRTEAKTAFLTHDIQLAKNARGMEFQVVGTENEA